MSCLFQLSRNLLSIIFCFSGSMTDDQCELGVAGKCKLCCGQHCAGITLFSLSTDFFFFSFLRHANLKNTEVLFPLQFLCWGVCLFFLCLIIYLLIIFLLYQSCMSGYEIDAEQHTKKECFALFVLWVKQKITL